MDATQSIWFAEEEGGLSTNRLNGQGGFMTVAWGKAAEEASSGKSFCASRTRRTPKRWRGLMTYGGDG